jgi:hypothetical protein
MPSRKDYSERREAYCAWLTANRIEPGDILLDSEVYLDTTSDGTRVIVYEACARDSQGRKHVNERGDGVALERRTTPLLVDPPDWWEPYRKPTRDQLLDVIDKLRKLVDARSPASMDGWEWEAGYDDALRAVQSILDGSKA